MRTGLKMGFLAWAAMCVSNSPLLAQNVVERQIFDGVKLASGEDLGVNSSENRTDWLSPDSGALKMSYPSGQAWGAVFITVGKPTDPPRPSVDLTAYTTLLVEVRGDSGSTLEIGIKDAQQPDDGNEQKVIVPVFSSYRTYAIPLSKFNKANLKSVYTLTEFVFSGSQAQTVWFRNIKYTSAPAPNVDSIVNGASFHAGAAAEGWVSLLGQNLSPTARGWADRDFQGKKLPTALDGVSVNTNDRDMAVAYIGPTQINALIFNDVATGVSSYISVTNSVGTSVPLRVVIQPADPALFVLSPQGGRYAAAEHTDGTIVGRPGLYGTAAITVPAKPGEIIQVFGNAFGPTSPLTVPDELMTAPAPLPASANLSAHLGTTPVMVQFAGLIAPGLYQLNLLVPNVADGDQRIFIDLGAASMQQEVYLTIQH
jgi:uncharacterized protein (TIGR03437 family)